MIRPRPTSPHNLPPLEFPLTTRLLARILVLLTAITLATKSLEQLCVLHETIRIKSGIWDNTGVFVYTTLNHLKYALPGG